MPYKVTYNPQEKTRLANSPRRWNGPFPFDDNAYFSVSDVATKRVVQGSLNQVQAMNLCDVLNHNNVSINGVEIAKFKAWQNGVCHV